MTVGAWWESLLGALGTAFSVLGPPSEAGTGSASGNAFMQALGPVPLLTRGGALLPSWPVYKQALEAAGGKTASRPATAVRSLTSPRLWCVFVCSSLRRLEPAAEPMCLKAGWIFFR